MGKVDIVKLKITHKRGGTSTLRLRSVLANLLRQAQHIAVYRISTLAH